jgi:hypothetical protein
LGDIVLKVNPGLKAAVDTLKGINKQVKKTTECTLADVIAYAGAEAIEASGGPRIQVRKLRRSVGVQSKYIRGVLFRPRNVWEN